MKVGDYVRTKSGIIGKIECKKIIGYSDWIIDTLYYNDDEIIDGWTCGIKEYDVIKASPNIIDLIEVGDYVNKEEVLEVIIDRNMSRVKTIDGTYFNEDIKSIVTREQFESIEYRTGE